MAETWQAVLWTALGGALGGPLRFLVSGVVGRAVGETYPWGTLAVNASGALAVGAVAAMFFRAPEPQTWAFLVTGVLGSYTTVSSFSLQTLALLQSGERSRAALNIALSVGLCLGAAGAGFGLAALVGA